MIYEPIPSLLIVDSAHTHTRVRTHTHTLTFSYVQFSVDNLHAPTQTHVSWLLTLQLSLPLFSLFAPLHLFLLLLLLLLYPKHFELYTCHQAPLLMFLFLILIFPHTISSLPFLACQQSLINVSQKHIKRVHKHEVCKRTQALLGNTAPSSQSAAHACVRTHMCMNVWEDNQSWWHSERATCLCFSVESTSLAADSHTVWNLKAPTKPPNCSKGGFSCKMYFEDIVSVSYYAAGSWSQTKTLSKILYCSPF